MTEHQPRILLVEDNPGDVGLIRKAVSNLPPQADLTHVTSLAEAGAAAGEHQFDLVLLDLGLPDSQGLETLREALADKALAGLPIIVLTGTEDEGLGLEVLRAGAQDYLIKGQASSEVLLRAIGYAIERHTIGRQLEAARAEAEIAKQRLEAVMEALPVGVALLDAQGGIIQHNRAYEQVWGGPVPPARSVEDYAAYQAWWTNSGQPVQPDEWASARAVRNGETVVGQSMRIQRFDGGQAFVLNGAAPILDAEGKIVGSAAAVMDVTARKQAEAQILSLAQFPAEDPHPVMRVSADGVAQYANVAALRQFADWELAVDQPVPAEPRALVRQALRAGQVQEAEILVGQRTFWFTLVPFPDAGYANAYCRDITARRQAEEALRDGERRLRQLNEELEERVQQRTADLDRLISQLRAEAVQRRQAEEQLQRTNRVLQMLSECDAALVRADDEQRLMEEVCRIAVEVGGYRMAWVGLAEDEPDRAVRPVAKAGAEAGYLDTAQISWADNERGRGPTGTAIRLNATQIGQDFSKDAELAPWRRDALRRGFRSSIALPLRDAGRAYGALTIYAAEPEAFGDDEARFLGELADDLGYGIVALRTRAALRDSRDRLRALASELTLTEQRERRRLARVLHDHLQQLLVGAKFRIAILGRAGDELVKKGADEIADLLGEAISASRSLTAELSPPVLHDSGLNGGLEWLARWMADKHGLFVELAMEEIPALAEDVKLLLFESVRELLFNAAKHARTRSARVNLRTVDDNLQIVVSDEGAGFDPKALRATDWGGGFGLFSIRERVNLFGGRVEIDSAPGQGSRFVLTAPLARTAAPATAQTLPPALAVRDAGPLVQEALPRLGGRIRVLLADDHTLIRQGLARLLDGEPDMEVVGEAADGQAAVELASRLRPNVVLMDLDMPRINGIDATRMIRRDLPEVAVVGLSIFEEKEQADAMLAAGAAAYLTKSGPAESLLAAIRACVEPAEPAAPSVAQRPRRRRTRRSHARRSAQRRKTT